MKKVVFIVLLIALIAAGYFFIYKANEQTGALSTTEESMITPVDMPEEAQHEMYTAIADYNKCMMQNRLAYHQQGISVANVADKTLQICEPHIEQLKAVLESNQVNVGLKEKMANTMRSRAVRKLMGAVMQSMSGQAAAMSNTPVESGSE